MPPSATTVPSDNDNDNAGTVRATLSDCVAQLQSLRRDVAGTTSTSTSTPSVSELNEPSLSELASRLREQRAAASTELNATAPRILLAGPAGSGKSTLINGMFGVDTASARAGGRPVTQSFCSHGPFSHAPVILIDSRGLERGSSYSTQVSEAVSYISTQNAVHDVAQHVHLVWYVPGGRWERGDRDAVRRLRAVAPVIVVVTKCDTQERRAIDRRSGMEARFTLRDAIACDFDDLDIVLCGDTSKQMTGWEPASCARGHPAEVFESVNNRTRTWRCQHDGCTETGTVPPGTRTGYDVLARCSASQLPGAIERSFAHAQRASIRVKNEHAVSTIRTGVLAMVGVAATPLPFSDMPLLLAAEGYMAVRLFALYNVPVAVADVAFFATLNAAVIGALGAAAKIAAGVLKASTIGLPVGVGVDMLVAASAGTAVGIAIARVAQGWAEKEGQQGAEQEFRDFVQQTVREMNFVALLKAAFQLLVFRDPAPITRMIQANVQGRNSDVRPA